VIAAIFQFSIRATLDRLLSGMRYRFAERFKARVLLNTLLLIEANVTLAILMAMLIFNFCARWDEREVVSRRLEDNLDLSVDSGIESSIG